MLLFGAFEVALLVERGNCGAGVFIMGLRRATARASAALAIVAIALGGCVAFPRTSDVSAFGQATERAVEAISAPHRMESTLLQQATVYGNACRYLAGSNYRLAAPLPQGSLIIREQARFLAALQGLFLTPDFFCAAVVKVCQEPHYEPLSLETDIDTIMQGKPADADHYID